MSVRPLVDREYLGQLAVVREPTGSVGRHRSLMLDGDSDSEYLPSSATSRAKAEVFEREHVSATP